MSDKIKPGINVRTTFVDGESPKAAKLNSLSSQLQAATQKLEACLGDIHSESYPYSSLTASALSLGYGRKYAETGALLGTPTRSLDIATIGRVIGPASNLNPHLLGPTTLTEAIPSGVYETSLNYPPDSIGTITFSDAAVFTTYQATTNGLAVSGDYHIDAWGRIYTVAMMAGGTVTYSVDPTKWAGGNKVQDGTFNVIPDPNQLEAGGAGCAIGALDGNSRRAVTLPTVTHHHYDESGTTIALTAADPTYGLQLELPKVLVDSWTAGEEIPGGFLYLKNYTKDKVYKNATYYYSNSTSIQIGTEDITTDVDDGDSFCIITVGTDICTSIDDLRRKSRHSHDRKYGEPLIPVDVLSGILAVPGNSGLFMPSEIPGNYFPQYLHRDGYTPGVDDNLNDLNVMRGDVALGAEGAVAGASTTTSGVKSYKLRFFGGSLGAAELYKAAGNVLCLVNADANADGTGFQIQPVTELVGGIRSDLLPASNIAIKCFTVERTINVDAFLLETLDLNALYGLSALATICGVNIAVRGPTGTLYKDTYSGHFQQAFYNRTVEIDFDSGTWNNGDTCSLKLIVWYTDN